MRIRHDFRVLSSVRRGAPKRDNIQSWGQLGDYLGAISVLAEKELQRNLIEHFA